MKKILLFIMLSMFVFSNKGLAEILIIDNNHDNYDLTRYISLLPDKANKLTLNQLINKDSSIDFTPVTVDLIRFSANNNTYWFKFEITNQSDRQIWVLDIDYAPLYDVRIFLCDSTGNIDTLQQAGILTKEKGFLIDKSSVSATLDLERGEWHEIYIRVETPSFLILPVNLMTQKAYFQKNNRKLTLIFFLFGIVFAAAIFNLFLFFQTRESVYSLLSIVIFMFIITALYQYGFDLFPQMETFFKERMRLLFFGLLMIALSILSIKYLDLTKFRNWYHVLIGMALVFSLFTLLVLLPFIPHLLMIRLTPWMNSLAIIVIFSASIHAYRKEVKSAIYFIIYNISFLISSFIWVMFLYDILPLNLFTRFTSLESVGIFSILVTLGLSEKITAIKKEREKSAMFSSLNKKLQEEMEERKKTEGALRESETRLLELNATKDRFYSIIGHDLMDPFNVLIGFSDMLEEALRNDQKEESLEYISIVQQSVYRIFNLLKSLLLWSQSQSGRIIYKPETFDLYNLINETIKVVSLKAQDKGITVNQKMEERLMVFGDPNLLGTVIRNLVNNAIKFTGSGGSVIIKATINENSLHVTVSDTGVGMKPEQLLKMFRIDLRSSTPGTDNETGNGFGLIICHEFITIHHGEIWAESSPGKGSDFHFIIPLKS